MALAAAENLRGDGKRGEGPGEWLLSDTVVGEFSPAGDPTPLQLKKEVSLFDARDMLGLGAGNDSLEVVVRCMVGWGWPLLTSASPDLVRPRDCFIAVFCTSNSPPALGLLIFSSGTASLTFLARFGKREEGEL